MKKNKNKLTLAMLTAAMALFAWTSMLANYGTANPWSLTALSSDSTQYSDPSGFGGGTSGDSSYSDPTSTGSSSSGTGSSSTGKEDNFLQEVTLTGDKEVIFHASPMMSEKPSIDLINKVSIITNGAYEGFYAKVKISSIDPVMGYLVTMAETSMMCYNGTQGEAFFDEPVICNMGESYILTVELMYVTGKPIKTLTFSFNGTHEKQEEEKNDSTQTNPGDSTQTNPGDSAEVTPTDTTAVIPTDTTTVIPSDTTAVIPTDTTTVIPSDTTTVNPSDTTHVEEGDSSAVQKQENEKAYTEVIALWNNVNQAYKSAYSTIVIDCYTGELGSKYLNQLEKVINLERQKQYIEDDYKYGYLHETKADYISTLNRANNEIAKILENFKIENDKISNPETNPNDSTIVNPGDSTIVNPSDSTIVNPSDSTIVNPSDSTIVNPSDSTIVNPSDSTIVNPSDSTIVNPSDSIHEEQSEIYFALKLNDSRYGKSVFLNEKEIYGAKVNVEYAIEPNAWRFVRLPEGVSIDKTSATTKKIAIRTYDGEQRAKGNYDATWVNVTPEMGSFDNGCIIQTAEFAYLTMVAPENYFLNTTDKTVWLTSYPSGNAADANWNLIANPYPAYYDFGCTDYTAPIVVWDSYTQNYQAYSPIDDNYVLTPYEAFFVQPTDRDVSIYFYAYGRMESLNGGKSWARSRGEEADGREVYDLTLSNGIDASDRTRVVLNDKADAAYEIGRDVAKFKSMSASAPQIYTVENGVNYSINERPAANGKATLGIMIPADGTYTIAATRAAQPVYLIDSTTGACVDLSAEGYTFEAKAGTNNTRFTVALGNTTGISDAKLATIGGNQVYTVSGMKVNKADKLGLYIANGKKYVVK